MYVQRPAETAQVLCRNRSSGERGAQGAVILGRRAFEPQKSAGHRVDKPQRFCVKGLSRKALRYLRPRRVGRDTAPSAIDRIADQGVPDMGHMHSDLMRAPGLQLTENLRSVAAECCSHLNACYCVASAVKQNRLPLPVRLVPRQVSRDFDDPAWSPASGTPWQSAR